MTILNNITTKNKELIRGINNKENINKAVEDKSIRVLFNTSLTAINEDNVVMNFAENDTSKEIVNDLVYIFAGGELPTKFLQKAGVEISKRYGHVVKKHK